MTAPATPGDARFPDVVRLIAQQIVYEGIVPLGRAGSQTPADLLANLPFIRINRVGGASDEVSDRPVIDVDVFHETSLQGQAFADEIRHFLTMTDLPVIYGYGAVDRIVCLTGPRELPWADTRVRRFGATYRVTTRRYYHPP